jgi:4'-phosphopantetheinyl transferase
MFAKNAIPFDLIDLRAKKRPDAVKFSENCVHVWQAHLELSSFQLQEFSGFLSEDERDRAKTFLFAQHRTHFIAARGFLRLILSRYLSIHPKLIRFRYTAFGKPVLDFPLAENPLHFNLSHSEGIALYVVSKRECGIDIEALHQQIDFMQLSEQFFSANELKRLHELPDSAQRTMFFQLWTRKEAYLKAIGQGLSLPLHQFDVSQSPDKPVLHLNTTDDEIEETDWYVKNFIPQEGYMAAVALKGNHHQISYFQVAVLK